MQPVWVGIDMASATFTGSVWQTEAAIPRYLGEFENTPDGFETVKQAITAHNQAEQQIHIVLEATGGYEQRLVVFANVQGWLVSLPNAKYVRDFAKSLGQRSKNDKVDANILAQFGATNKPPAQRLLPEEVGQLEQLQNRRQQLEKQLKQEESRFKQWQFQPSPNPDVLASFQASLTATRSALAAIEIAIKALLKQHPQHKQMVKRLRTVPGVGPKNSIPLLIFLHRFQARTAGNGTRKGITAYCGLDPKEFASGSSIRKRPTISKMGDGVVRHYLYMGALGGISGHNALRYFYKKMVNRNKAKRLALVSAARKILVWSFMVFTNEVDFDPSKHPIPASIP